MRVRVRIVGKWSEERRLSEQQGRSSSQSDLGFRPKGPPKLGGPLHRSRGADQGQTRRPIHVHAQSFREPAASARRRAAACCLIRQAIVPFIARPGDQRAFRVQSVSRTGSESVRKRLRNSVDHYTSRRSAMPSRLGVHGDAKTHDQPSSGEAWAPRRLARSCGLRGRRPIGLLFTEFRGLVSRAVSALPQTLRESVIVQCGTGSVPLGVRWPQAWPVCNNDDPVSGV